MIGLAVSTAEEIPSEIVISTDYPQTLFSKYERAIILNRPPRLAMHDTPMWDVLTDVARRMHIADDDIVVLLQPTSLHEDRAGIVRRILADHVRHAVTVDRYPDRWHPWYALTADCDNHPPACRQKIPPRFRANGLVYLMTGRTARLGTFWGQCPKFYEVPGVTNIDTMADWNEAVRLYGG